MLTQFNKEDLLIDFIENTSYKQDLQKCYHSKNGLQGEINPYHIEDDCWTHTMLVFSHAKTYEEAICALWHDTGKPLAREEAETEKGTKVRFFGHEGLSTYNFLNNCSYMQTPLLIDIAKAISLHGHLFDYINDNELFSKFCENEKCFNIVKGQLDNDNNGRFTTSPKTDMDLNSLTFIHPKARDEVNKRETPNTITVLCGLPCSGKSTWVKNLDTTKVTVISRDNLLLEMYGNDYSVAFKNQDSKLVDETLNKRFNKAIRNREDVVVDMTNMSIKSRRRWISTLPSCYYKQCMFFFEKDTVLEERNKERSKTGKIIPQSVFINMKKSFIFPTIAEGFDAILYHGL